MSTWLILGAGVALGVGLTLAIAWLFSLSRRVARLEAVFAHPSAPPSTSRELTIGGTDE